MKCEYYKFSFGTCDSTASISNQLNWKNTEMGYNIMKTGRGIYLKLLVDVSVVCILYCRCCGHTNVCEYHGWHIPVSVLNNRTRVRKSQYSVIFIQLLYLNFIPAFVHDTYYIMAVIIYPLCSVLLYYYTIHIMT